MANKTQRSASKTAPLGLSKALYAESGEAAERVLKVGFWRPEHESEALLARPITQLRTIDPSPIHALPEGGA